mmetsp:Transcript_73990/g.233685  ORF Transcript_73990/g.233685 Transcript_73990/m.233685 type:complete len:415 (-) Transcript_73990:1160-2404(-)
MDDFRHPDRRAKTGPQTIKTTPTNRTATTATERRTHTRRQALARRMVQCPWPAQPPPQKQLPSLAHQSWMAAAGRKSAPRRKPKWAQTDPRLPGGKCQPASQPAEPQGMQKWRHFGASSPPPRDCECDSRHRRSPTAAAPFDRGAGARCRPDAGGARVGGSPHSGPPPHADELHGGEQPSAKRRAAAASWSPEVPGPGPWLAWLDRGNKVRRRQPRCSRLEGLVDVPACRSMVRLSEESGVLHGGHRVVPHLLRDGRQGDIDVHAVGAVLVEHRRLPQRLDPRQLRSAVEHCVHAPVGTLVAAPGWLVGIRHDSHEVRRHTPTVATPGQQRSHLPVARQLLAYQTPEARNEVIRGVGIILHDDGQWTCVCNDLHLHLEVRCSAAHSAQHAPHVVLPGVRCGLSSGVVEVRRDET